MGLYRSVWWCNLIHFHEELELLHLRRCEEKIISCRLMKVVWRKWRKNEKTGAVGDWNGRTRCCMYHRTHSIWISESKAREWKYKTICSTYFVWKIINSRKWVQWKVHSRLDEEYKPCTLPGLSNPLSFVNNFPFVAEVTYSFQNYRTLHEIPYGIASWRKVQVQWLHLHVEQMEFFGTVEN